MKVLVTGGAGYIGSHMVKTLIEADHQVTVLDNLSNGYRDAVHPEAEFILGDLENKEVIYRVFEQEFDGVIHFASFIQVGESVIDPGMYYHNNVCNTLNLLDVMVKAGCFHLIFSSTAAIFGNPKNLLIDELHPTSPINPYGRSKWIVEGVLKDYEIAYGLKSICLRYFNAAGAAPDGSLGERHNPETHLIPLVLKTALGQRPSIEIYGNDYRTPDGTCIRDYIHVIDLCEAHMLALYQLIKTGKSSSYNLGNGNGFSVKEIIKVAEKVTGNKIPTRIATRRAGDPDRLVSNPKRAIDELGWRPRYNSLEQIISDAWRWVKKGVR